MRPILRLTYLSCIAACLAALDAFHAPGPRHPRRSRRPPSPAPSRPRARSRWRRWWCTSNRPTPTARCRPATQAGRGLAEGRAVRAATGGRHRRADGGLPQQRGTRDRAQRVLQLARPRGSTSACTAPASRKSVTFDKPGPVLLYCSIHRYMDGVVFVSPTPYTSLVDKDGRYEIKDVPPGKWTLKTWQRRRRFPEQTIPVTVEAGKPATVDMELKRQMTGERSTTIRHGRLRSLMALASGRLRCACRRRSPAPSAAAVVLEVVAEAEGRREGRSASPACPSTTPPRGRRRRPAQFELVDYSALDDIIVWLEPAVRAMRPPASEPAADHPAVRRAGDSTSPRESTRRRPRRHRRPGDRVPQPRARSRLALQRFGRQRLRAAARSRPAARRGTPYARRA